jgi:hypothetical protein
MSIFALAVVLILLVVGDRVAVAIAENDIANQIQSQAKLTAKPSVNIPGFPFLTQVISKDLHEVDISMNNVPAGPVTITSIHAVAKGLHINGSWNGGLIDSINGTAFVSFGALGNALSSTGTSQIVNIALSQAGPNKVKATASFAGLASVTETATVTQTGNKIMVVWDNNGSSGGGILGGVLGGNGPTLPNLSFTLPPNVPAGLKLASVSVTSQGVMATVSAQHTYLSE